MPTEEITEVESQGLALIGEAETVRQITTAQEFQQAGAVRRAIKAYIREVKAITGPVVAATNQAHKAAVAQQSALLAYAEKAEGIVNVALSDYETRERARKREEERKAEEIRQQAEAEARRLAAIAEVAARKVVEDQILAEAAAAEARGDTAAAQRIIAAPIPMPVFIPPAPVFTPHPVAAVPKIEGLSFVDHYSAKVTDLGALVRAVAAGQAPLTLVEANGAALNAMARALKEEMRIPGVEPVNQRCPSGK